MAQSVERRIGSAEVTGSIPVISFNEKPARTMVFLVKSMVLAVIFFMTKLRIDRRKPTRFLPQIQITSPSHFCITYSFLSYNIIMNSLKHYTIIGIIFVLITGTISHFIYDWSGNNFILGLLFPINESTWEHMKLSFFPMLLYSVYMNAKIKHAYPCVTSSLLFGILLSTFLIPVLFYTYSGILGRNFMLFDILTFVVSVLFSFIAVYMLSLSCKMTPYTSVLKLAVFTLMICFFLFTYHPLDIGIFINPAT